MTSSFTGLGGKRGLSPGTLVSSPGREQIETRITLLRWSEEEFSILDVDDPASPAQEGEDYTVRWMRIRGFSDLSVVNTVGGLFGIHPLQLEDAVNRHDRPKAELDEESVFVTLSSIFPGNGGPPVHGHLALFLKPGILISFEEGDTPLFDAVVDRMKRGGSRLRRYGPDYLFYALMDAVVDGYFATLEDMADRIEKLEEDVVEGDGSDLLERIHSMRNEMLLFRRSVWPMRELVGNLTRTGDSAFSSVTLPYIRDLYDHAVQVVETSETLREMLSAMLDTYLSSTSNRMNEVMKVLTIIATIFMPLTFIAGIYGMNFEHMPELGKAWAYPAVLGAMVLIGFGMGFWFRKKGWL
ncbi:MAG: magnesium/cobalt transporter CorA [Candidatus Fermentibacter sp.]|nr:magnesium/cobalt transporter CorA [Candidatus Fermentibacter sp.]